MQGKLPHFLFVLFQKFIMENFWNDRYAGEEYVYGTAPNAFFKQELEKLSPGRILLPGEGEGRNAVFAASRGWEVSAFDSSGEGKRKAEKLASLNNVRIDYRLSAYEDFQAEPESYDCIAFIYTHMPSSKRKEYHQKLTASLKAGGILILECFSKKQIHYNTGGPKDADMLFSGEELQKDFGNFTRLSVTETEIEADEGPFHRGTAAVIRVHAIK